MRYWPRLALKHDPLDLSLPSSQDYRHELLVPVKNLIFDTDAFIKREMLSFQHFEIICENGRLGNYHFR
jgi:hypothetical protein